MQKQSCVYALAFSSEFTTHENYLISYYLPVRIRPFQVGKCITIAPSKSPRDNVVS